MRRRGRRDRPPRPTDHRASVATLGDDSAMGPPLSLSVWVQIKDSEGACACTAAWAPLEAAPNTAPVSSAAPRTTRPRRLRRPPAAPGALVGHSRSPGFVTEPVSRAR